MQKVKRVLTNDFYKQNYIAVGNNIFTEQKAMQYFSEQKIDILKLTQIQRLPLSHIMPITYLPLPSQEQMLKEINEKREQIYKELDLILSVSQKEKEDQAQKIFYYLVNHLNYDMTTQEEILNANSHQKLHSYLHFFRKKVKAFQKHYEDYLNAKEPLIKKHNEDLCKKEEVFLEKIKAKLDKEEIKVQNQVTVEAIYYAFIKQRGVCNDFSYAYSYLLQGLDIENYVATILESDKMVATERPITHTVNILKTKEQNKDTFAVADVTLGINLNKNFAQAIFIDKNRLKSIYPHFEILHIGQLNSLKENERFVNNYYKGTDLINNIMAQLNYTDINETTK